MTNDLQPLSRAQAHPPLAGRWLVRNGAELVHLVEQLYVNFLRLSLVLLVVGCAISITLGSPYSEASPGLLTGLIAALGALLCAFGLTRPEDLYRWLRRSGVRQALPAAVAAVALAVNGPDSPSWWVALPLLWMVAVVGSSRMVFIGGLITGAAYLAGTTLAGQSLLPDGDTGILGGAIALPVNAVVGRFACDVFARFVLRLHQLERGLLDRGEHPISVPNLESVTKAQSERSTGARRSQVDRYEAAAVSSSTRLTPRQLEAVLLACDGLRNTEIAACLGISARQVERLMHDARHRSGADTQTQLVAMLVAARVAPEPVR